MEFSRKRKNEVEILTEKKIVTLLDVLDENPIVSKTFQGIIDFRQNPINIHRAESEYMKEKNMLIYFISNYIENNVKKYIGDYVFFNAMCPRSNPELGRFVFNISDKNGTVYIKSIEEEQIFAKQLLSEKGISFGEYDFIETDLFIDSGTKNYFTPVKRNHHVNSNKKENELFILMKDYKDKKFDQDRDDTINVQELAIIDSLYNKELKYIFEYLETELSKNGIILTHEFNYYYDGITFILQLD